MADDADMTDKDIFAAVVSAVEATRLQEKAGRRTLPKGRCHYCDKEVGGAQLFCDRECGDGWDYEERRKRELGR